MLEGFTGLSRRLGLSRSLALHLNTTLRSRAITRGYARMIHEDFEMIRPHLPADAARILDIGCGIGGLDVLLHRHYSGEPGPVIDLLDRTNPRTIPSYGFHREMEFYNALEISSAVLRDNGIPADAFRTLDAADGEFPKGPLDLVISIASWGFHYPLSTYLDRVVGALDTGGTLILDLRRGQGQVRELELAFARVESIGPVWNDKARRYRAHQPTADRHDVPSPS